MSNTNTINRPKCGEIWMCNLSNNKNNTYSPTLNVIPITSKMNKRRLPIHVELKNHQQYGLRVPSTMLVEQIMTIPINCLDKCIGEIVDNETLNDIRRAIGIQFPIVQLMQITSMCH